MSESSPQPTLDRFLYIWWVRLPLLARRLSANLAVALVDGLYLGTQPLVGRLASPIVLLAGLLIGWLHLGFYQAFSESMAVLVLATALGVMSGHLGAVFLGGFALGDFFLASNTYTFTGAGPLAQLARVYVPMLLEYGLLALLLINVPIVTKGLLVQLRPSPRLNRQIRFGVAVIGHATVTGVLVYFWTQIVPILIRPVYTWQGSSPPVSAMAPLQENGWVLVFIAVAASLGRMVWQGRTASHSESGARMDLLQRHLASATPVTPLTQRLSPWGGVVVQALWAALLLSGMMTSWFDAVLLGGLILLLQAARIGLVPVPLGPWPAIVGRVPLVLRLLVGLVIVFFLSRPVLQDQLGTTESFRPFVILTCAALLVFYLLAPGSPRLRQQQDEVTS